MDTLVVSVFERENDAWDRVVDMSEAVARKELDVRDVCAVVRRDDGKVRIRETREMAPKHAAGWGAAWGFLAGAFLGFPVVSSLVAGSAAGLAARRRDVGVTHEFEEEVAARLAPGRAAVIVLVESEGLAPVRERLERGSSWCDVVELADQRPRGKGGASNSTRSSRKTRTSSTDIPPASSTSTGTP